MSKLLEIFTILVVTLSLSTSAPSGSQSDFTENFSKDVTKNLTAYIIAGAVILCIIVALLCWTAAKGCCCIFKIVLLVGCGLALFTVITKGTLDYKDS